MVKAFQRPKGQTELEQREAAGFWKAIGLVNELSRTDGSACDTSTLCQVHRTIFEEVRPEIAGRYRAAGEDVQKLHHLLPPPGSQVASLMLEFGRELGVRIASLPPKPKTKQAATYRKWLLKVVEVAAWVQHKIVAVHPFPDGNGRTARLFTNLILQKQGLTGSRIKFEQNDKTAYLNALAQVDKVQDYEPLVEIILHAMKDQYQMIQQRKAAYMRAQKRLR